MAVSVKTVVAVYTAKRAWQMRQQCLLLLYGLKSKLKIHNLLAV